MRTTHEFQVKEAEDMDDLRGKIREEIEKIDPLGHAQVADIRTETYRSRYSGIAADVTVILEEDNTNVSG